MKFLWALIVMLAAVFAVDLASVSFLGEHLWALSCCQEFRWTQGLDGQHYEVMGAATLATTAVTLMEWAKRLDPDGKVAVIVELLAQTNEILLDMIWREGNLPTGHRTTVRTGLPSVAWRLLNGGVLASKSTSAQIDEQAGMLEAWSSVDKDLALLNGNINAFRLSEAKPFIEAMNQEMAQTLFYGNSGLAPEEFTGLAPRYSSLSAANGQNIVNGAGAGSDNTSIWLIVWSEETVCGIFPKGSKAGLIHEDRGEQVIQNANGVTGALMVALMDRFQWKAGIALKDWRYAVRGANIDVSSLVANAGAEANLITMMTKMVHRIPAMGMGRPAFYVNRTVAEFLDIQYQAKVSAGGGLTYETVEGRRIAKFRGIPIRTCDAILETEATVS